MFGVARRSMTVSTLAMLALAFALTPLVTHTSTAMANTTTGTGSGICGVLVSYVPATAYSAGQVVISNTVYYIAPNSSLGLNGSAFVGQNVCLSGSFNAGGQIVSGTLVGNTVNTGTVCGVVSGFVPATTLTPGYIIINGQTYPIAPNTGLGVSSIPIGTTYCLNSGTGLLSGGYGSQAFYVCGVIVNYVPPTQYSLGSITLGNQTYSIVPGVSLLSTGLVGTGTVCLNGTVNGAGQITSGTFGGIAGTTTPISVCGALGGFTPPTGASSGSIVINGQTYTIAPGVLVSGGALLTLNSGVCLNGSATAPYQLIAASVSPFTLAPVSVCGAVSAYVPATASTAGSITVGGQTYGIAPGFTISGSSLLAIGASQSVCLSATLNGAGQITSGSIGGNATSTPTVDVCGAVTAYTPATATAGGTITVAGRTLVINAGTSFVGASQPATGMSVCLTLVVDSTGAVLGGTVVNTTGGVPLSATLVVVSGRLPAFARPE